MNSTSLARVISKVFLVVGASIFFFGDRALREIWKVRFVFAELFGIGGGIALMLLGAAIRPTAIKQSVGPEGSDRQD